VLRVVILISNRDKIYKLVKILETSY